MELPFHLKTLEPLPGALDILRFFGRIDAPTADADQIIDRLDMTERRFSKAIRRLVTKGYIQMDGNMVYRLTEQGASAVDELSRFDNETGGRIEIAEPAVEIISRRMVVVLPQTLIAGQEHNVHIGFHPADGVQAPSEVVVRMSVVNGEPQSPDDAIFTLTGDYAKQTLQVRPDPFDQVRLKFQVFQLGDNPGEIGEAGGMYVDVPVAASGTPSQMVAYGTDVALTP